MAMLNAIVKGGFYPYPPEQLPAACSLFAPAPQEGGRSILKVLDPCAGEGAALAYLGANLNLEPYANELDVERAARCIQVFGREQTVQGDLFRLRASHEAFALVWCNPPYGENYGGDDRRIELSALRHSWKWAMVGGYVAWIVYAHHVTTKAAEFLSANAGQVDVYRLPGLHLGRYAQILAVARKIERREPDAQLAQQLVESCRSPHSLPELARLDAPRYRLPAPPEIKRFVFAPDEITPDVMLAAMHEHGAQQMAGFQQLLTPMPPPPGFHPIVQPRGGHLGLVLAGGLLDGAQIETDEGSAAVRGVVRLVTVDTTPEGQHGVRETYQTRPQVTVSLLWKDGRIKTIEAENALVDFLKTHKTRLLEHLGERSKPIYDFQLDPALLPIFQNVFQNRRLPGRPTSGLFAVQKHVVGAVYEALKVRKGVIVVGEMGVGKSAIGAVLAGALHEKMRPGQIAALMCPPHLVDKWVREIHDAVPGSLAEVVETVDQVSAFMSKAEAKPEQLHVLVMSRERAKLHEGWEPSCQIRHHHQARWARGVEPPERYANQPRIVTIDVLLCPTCGQTITRSEHGEQRPAPMSWLVQQPRRCPACKGALWQMKRTFSAPAPGELSPKRNPRYALAGFLRHCYPGRLGLAIIDEIHETKSGSTDQGQAMQTLVGAADKAIGLTGTLFGGVSSSVFWLEWAFNPRMYAQYPIKEGRTPAIGRWVQQMGVLEQLVEFKEDDNAKAGAYSGKRRVEHRPKEAPGISPYLVKELLDHCVWVGLPDLGFALPDYSEIPVDIDLPPQVQDAYRRARETMVSYLNGCRMEGDASFLGAYLQSLLSYPSSCFRQETVVHRHCRQGQVVRENVVTVIPGFGSEQIYPKETWLLETLEQELRAGRRCAVFVRQTGTRDIQTRLKELIDKQLGIAKSVILPGSVEARSRDERLKGWVKNGINVLICNPRLVQTGMDLLDFPTLIFFEIDYSLYVTAQASRRAWRIGQTQECRVYYPFYSGTMEEQAIALVSRKQEAAALLSGNVDGGGLAALNGDSGSSLVAELARVVAEDEAVVDLGQLFRRQAEGSADFESGWAQAWAAGEKIAPDEKAAPAAQQPEAVPTDPVSPLRRQYLAIKKQHPTAILFFRMGDFYETFDDDAGIIARELDVVLTSRSVSKGRRVPMAGVPHHAAQNTIDRLIEKGHQVAVCEPVGDEPMNGVMPRQVTLVIAPQPLRAKQASPTLEQLRKKYQWHMPTRPSNPISPQLPQPAGSGAQLPLFGMAAPGGGD